MKLEPQSLTRAASEGDAEAVRTLLANGVSVDEVSSGGQTALMLASIFGHKDVVALLLLAGADPTLTDPRGLTADEWATRRGFADLAQLIEKRSGRDSRIRRQHPPSSLTDHTAASTVDTTTEVREPKPKEISATPKMGGAAAAILRNHVGRTSNRSEILEGDVAEAPQVEEAHEPLVAAPTLEAKTEEPAPVQPVEKEVTTRFEPPPVPTDIPAALAQSRLLKFVPKEDDTSVRTRSTFTDSAPNLYPPDVVFAKHDTALDVTTTEDKEQEPEAPSERKLTELIETETTPPSPRSRETAPPAFLSQQSTSSSGRSLLWILVAVTLGASAFGAYRLNSYLSRPDAAPATANQPAEPKPQVATQPTTATNAATNPITPENTDPVSGGPLAGTEIELPKPDYPASAKRKGVEEVITITVRVNRAGKVISWLTGKGDASLRAAALKAAKRSTFSPEKLPGEGEVVGTITYNFKLPAGEAR